MIQTSTRNSLFLAGRLFIVKLIESLGGVFAPEVPEGEQTEGKCGKRAPVAADDWHAVVVHCNDDEGAGNGDRVRGIKYD